MTIRADSSEIGHSAKDESKWTGSGKHGDVNDRLDELADRATTIETTMLHEANIALLAQAASYSF